MAFSRRGVLGTLIGAPAALTAILSSQRAISAETYPRIMANGDLTALERHPIFGFQDITEGGEAYALRKLKATPAHQSEVTITILKEKPEPERFATLREAEDAAFAYMAQKMKITTHALRYEANAYLVYRSANQIVKETGRGLGNRVLVAEDTLQTLLDGNSAYRDRRYREDDSGTRVDRWKFAGTLNNAIEVWTTREVPDLLKNDRALIAYRGSKMDSGIVLCRDQDGFGLVLNRPWERAVAEGRDYFKLVTLSRDSMEAAA